MNLESSIQSIPRISPAYQKRLLKLGIKTLKDLFYHFPFRYDDFSKIVPISELKLNDVATVQGKITEIKNTRTWKRRMNITEAFVQDDTGIIRVIWFNQPFLADTLKEDSFVSLSGKVSFDKSLYLSNPAYEKLNTKYKIQDTRYSPLRHTGRLVPVYPETAGLSSRYLRYIIQIFSPAISQIKDWLPLETKKSQKLINIGEAIKQIHFPNSPQAVAQARRRLAFDELFLIQLFVLQQKLNWQKENSLKISFDEALIKNFVAGLPFKLTNGQRKAAWEILQDLQKTKPMNRLLEGDVGSGKTVVAAMAALEAAQAGYQVALMAPTEILAQQHFNTLNKLLTVFGIKICLITGSDKKLNYESGIMNKGKNKKNSVHDSLFIIQNSDIVIGTHALIQEKISFKKLALVILDEQHRFGVSQRATLARGITQTDTQTNADTTLLYDDITYKIRGCIFAVKKNIGLGHKESIYQKALEQEFNNAGLKFEKEKRINIIYNNKKIGTYQPDFIIENKILLELKALPFIGNTEKRQIWTYLKGSEYRLGLLVNYSPTDVEIKRIVYDSARDLPRQSASSPRQSAFMPHLLSMTATPIPRTLALTIYGDLDISILDELPSGRQKIITQIVGPASRQTTYEFISQQAKQGRQVFVICPRIEISNKSQETSEQGEDYARLVTCHMSHVTNNWDDVKAVKEEYEKLSKKIFPDLKIGMLHGRLKPKEKERVMLAFKNKEIDILVSTSVVEVGIDIPNATVMMIEGAERFGLAQLHQFRGRVGRSEHQSYCFLFSESKSNARLKAMLTAKNGFELAEKDLAIRGPGEFFGTKQSGLPDLSMASLADVDLIKQVRQEAAELLQKDPVLKTFPLLSHELEKFQKTIHLE